MGPHFDVPATLMSTRGLGAEVPLPGNRDEKHRSLHLRAATRGSAAAFPVPFMLGVSGARRSE